MTKQEFDRFVSENGKDILRFCRMNTGGTAEGDDLYQDTMLKLWEQADQLNKNDSLTFCFHPYVEKQEKEICLETQDRSV